MPVEFHSATILRYKAEFDLDIAVKAELGIGMVYRKIKSKSLTGGKISPTVLFGR